MSFSKIAKVYDRFNDLESYENWLDFTLNSVEKKPKKVLDVACGTGWFASMLAPFVGSLTAIDIDEEMLTIAKTEDPKSNISYRQADMLSMQWMDNDFDLVTCFADSLCFLENKEAVAVALDQMLERLVSGGTLLFDVWTPYQVSEGFKGFSYFDSDNTAALMWDSEVYPKELKVEHYLTVFSQLDNSQHYQRQEITLTERTYSLSVYRQILATLPVKSVEILVDYGVDYYDAKRHKRTERWFFRVIKQ